MPDPADPRHPLVEVGRYSRLADARERGLVAAARDLPHWIEREDDEWVLKVEAPAREAMLAELRAFEREERALPESPPPAPPEPIETLSLFVAAWVLSTFFLVQNLAGERWMVRGEALSEAIVKRGEWWRTLTALTLHADVAHIVANLGSGLIFAGFVSRHFGGGLTWLFVVLSGAMGNAINAWGYRGEQHASIGASTAVFGALGLLVGAEFVDRLRSPRTRGMWQLVLPIGAGLALLAYLGVGEEHGRVDFMAHFWGFIVGIPLGALAGFLRLKHEMPRWLQRLCGLLAVGLLGGAWWRAWH